MSAKKAKQEGFTPNAKIKAQLRKLFLRSEERGFALKRDQATCVLCGVKHSRKVGEKVFVEVHHKRGVTNWERIYAVIREELLCHPDGLETLCEVCHRDAEEAKKAC